MTRAASALCAFSLGLIGCHRPPAPADRVDPAAVEAADARPPSPERAVEAPPPPPPRTAEWADPPEPVAVSGRYRVEREPRYTRLLADRILWTTQANTPYFHPLDALTPFGSGGAWDALALTGALRAWDLTLEPLTYYHRAGPVGAMFHVLRGRDGPPPPVGVVGLHGGTPAAYAGPGQSITFYERDSDLKKLVAGTDRYFTYLADARTRGAAVDVRFGDVRRNLERDADKRFGLLLVELHDTGFDPGDRLTLEAVRLYRDRTAADGIVALHISNKDYRLEPVVAAIARELKLAGRVWNDDSEGRPGKTASDWVVLARDEKALGAMAAPVPDQALAFGDRKPALLWLLGKYGPSTKLGVALEREHGGPGVPAREVARRVGAAALGLSFGRVRLTDTLGSLAYIAYGPMFRPLKAEFWVGVRRDGDTGRPPPARGGK